MKYKKKEAALIFAFFTILVFGLLIFTGTITSGLHYVDDHEFIHYDLLMKADRSNLFGCLKEVVQFDLSHRFRPLYNILRVFLIAVIGPDFFLASILKAIEIVLTLFFLYWCARLLKCDRLYAILFSLIIMVGPQSVVWWKLGPQESTGTLAFACGFYCLLRGLYENKKSSFFFSVLFILCASLYKESYILTIPFVMAFIIYDKCKDDEFCLKRVKEGIMKTYPLLLIYLMIFSIEMVIIVFCVGTNKIGYAGIDFNTSLSEYKVSWENSYHNYLNWFIYFGISAFLIMLTYINKWKKVAGYFFLSIIFILPQCILYLKTGLEERYILPWAFGYAFFLVVLPNKLFSFEKKVGVRQRIYTCILIGLLIPHFAILVREAKYFAYNGESIGEVLETVLLNSDSDSKILSAYSPYMESDLTVSYWMLENERENIYIWNEDSKECNIALGPKQGTTADVSDMDIILFYNTQNRHFCYIPDIDLSDYEVIDIGTLTYCQKKLE